jgi:glutathione S-transferase
VLLYDSAISGNCYKVRLLLSQLRIEFERREVEVVNRGDRVELLGDKNPAARIPILRLDDGTHLAESNAILWYLGEGTPFVPSSRLDRARALQWMFFEQYSHEPYVAVARYWLVVQGRDPGEISDLAHLHERGYAALDGMERHLTNESFLVGDSYTVADISLYAYTHLAGTGGFELERYPAIVAWLARVAQQPGHVPIDS